jgi:hypothetical protein
MNNAINLGFVYLGGNLPRYAKKNLLLTKERFPNHRIVLISDRIENDKFKGIDFFLFDNSFTSEEYRLHSSHDSTFREGFWIQTMARFAALADYMSHNPQKPLIHFELDVWIAENFPFYIFESLNCETAFSLPALTEGSAAVLFLRDSLAAAKLSSIFRESIMNSPTSTDMTILRKIYDENLMDVVGLPITPDQVNSNNSNFDKFLFDPSSWGMYFLGQDPRNSRGFQIFHRQEKHHVVDPSRFDVDSDGRTVKVVKDSEEYSLVNLHVHSKDLRIFRNLRVSSRNIEKYLSKRSKREFVEFKLIVFTRQLGKKLFKEIRSFLWKIKNA